MGPVIVQICALPRRGIILCLVVCHTILPGCPGLSMVRDGTIAAAAKEKESDRSMASLTAMYVSMSTIVWSIRQPDPRREKFSQP